VSDLHWTERLDQSAAERAAEQRAQHQRQLDEASRAHVAAVAAKRAKYGWSLGDIDFDAPSQTEQAYQAQQADYDRHRRWAQYAAEHTGHRFKADGTPVEYDVTSPPQWFE
jgi:hypothetical protein